jgi:hypothetical protein
MIYFILKRNTYNDAVDSSRVLMIYLDALKGISEEL